MTSTKTRSALDDLVIDIRTIVSLRLPDQTTAEAVAARIGHVLPVPDLLTGSQREGGTDGYRQHVLHVEPDGAFSVVALVWLPGQATPVHDHVCWCAVGVYEGQETELRYRRVGRRLVRTRFLVNAAGTVSGIAPPGDIHRVMNSGRTKAISLHVYGADIGRLGSSIRRTYDDRAEVTPR